MDWDDLLAGLKPLRQQLDRVAEQNFITDAAVKIYCQNGCSNCCSLSVNCSFPEAVAIARELTAEQIVTLKAKIPLLQQISTQAQDLKDYLRQFRNRFGGCPFLDAAGSCSIYPHRPLSCRALLSTRNSSWCGVDFADLHPLERDAFLSSLDRDVVAFPTHYLAATQEMGMELEAAALADMRDRFGVAVSGNLLYQVWLELEYRISEIIPQGFSATRKYLEGESLDLPYMLHLQGAERG
ncbi:Putative zinc-or iron-chelating domain-containing protein [Malonomonas rubra DSM 5091]|uniref:Putative zinc-or iron-chelating domain-containing protein n=1 Tax=Malonomonas rubra DSM 5091 TaxID=1122189 RepID=A0A1M6IMP4_MALRU|nr:YkgJ family cysteine cluster protein [Malonomonas rubra]SHJ35717.1 Putative zinc-or iron-chelating domain-containing protein [Malonomonas rubra DSM 5091]